MVMVMVVATAARLMLFDGSQTGEPGQAEPNGTDSRPAHR